MKQKIKQNKKLQQNQLPKITSKQKQILSLLYKFRFLHTNHFQKLLKHKNPTHIQLWLKDLKDKGYIKRQQYTNLLDEHTKPAIYYLTLQSRQILKKEKDYDVRALNKLYKEAKRTESFISYCLVLADIYLFFLSQVKKEEVLKFFTESQLLEYDYFPHPLPSAYIAVKAKNKTKRYFLELFKEYAPIGVLQSRVKGYLQYFDEGNWKDHANGEPFPMVLFICPTENIKKQIMYYAKAVFEKEYEEKFSLFLTTRAPVTGALVWEKVES